MKELDETAHFSIRRKKNIPTKTQRLKRRRATLSKLEKYCKVGNGSESVDKYAQYIAKELTDGTVFEGCTPKTAKMVIDAFLQGVQEERAKITNDRAQNRKKDQDTKDQDTKNQEKNGNESGRYNLV